jgi:hypothetical protein
MCWSRVTALEHTADRLAAEEAPPCCRPLLHHSLIEVHTHSNPAHYSPAHTLKCYRCGRLQAPEGPAAAAAASWPTVAVVHPPGLLRRGPAWSCPSEGSCCSPGPLAHCQWLRGTRSAAAGVCATHSSNGGRVCANTQVPPAAAAAVSSRLQALNASAVCTLPSFSPTHLCAHECQAAGRLRKPLVPADGCTNAPKASVPHLEAGVTRAEVELLLVPAEECDNNDHQCAAFS